MANEIIFPTIGDKRDEFLGELEINLQEEGCGTEQVVEDDEERLKVENAPLFSVHLLSRREEDDLIVSFERKGMLTVLGLLFLPTIVLFIVSFLIGRTMLLFIAIVPVCAGQMWMSKKTNELNSMIQGAMKTTIDSFPKLKEAMDEKREERRQERLEEADETFTCPMCSKEFTLAELVSLHLEREHDIEWRELQKKDFEDGKVKEEVLQKLEEQTE